MNEKNEQQKYREKRYISMHKGINYKKMILHCDRQWYNWNQERRAKQKICQCKKLEDRTGWEREREINYRQINDHIA